MRTARLRLATLLACATLASGCARMPVPAPAPPPAPPGSTSPSEVPVPPRTPVPQQTPVPEAGLPGEEPWITVGLAWDLKGVAIDPEGAAVVEGATRHALARGDQLSVTLEGGRGVVRAIGSKVRWSARLAAGETLSVTPEQGTTIRWNDQQWRGQFRVFINPRGTLTLVTRLQLESYLAGVVPGEIGALGEDVIEAGRAQAIAARSYTLFYRGRRAAEGFDVYATVEDQLYVAVEGERPLASRCVETTAGKVAVSDGRPVRANYCSTCGGITADVWEAWPADPLPYLVSRRDRPTRAGEGTTDDYCAASRHFRWQEEWPAAEFLSNLAEFCRPNGIPLPPGRLGALVDVSVESRSRSGRVWRLAVQTTAGPVVIPAWSLRQVLRRPGNPRAILRSTLFKVDVRRDPRTDRVLSVVASGAGSGHGVGLCQTGALGMARQGRKAEDILRHYYRGAEIKRLY
jgi:stage II sporulation protein D (peptidoglycan lytic transglycosylase)